MRRIVLTRQIAFRARSIVSIIASELTTSAIRPTAPSRLARLENWLIALITDRAMLSGTSVCTK